MKRVIPIVIVVVLVVGGVFVLSRLGRRGEPSREPQPGPEKAKQQIALVVRQTGGGFWRCFRRGAEKAVEGTNFALCWEQTAEPASSRQQGQLVEKFVSEGVSGLVVVVSGGVEELQPALRKASDANIVSVVVGVKKKPESAVCCLWTDQYIAGLLAARRLGRLLGGKGSIGVVKFVPDAGDVQQREYGFVDTIKREFPQIKIAASVYGMETVATAEQAVGELLSQQGKLDGIFASNESTAIGVLRVLRRQSLAGKVKFVCFGLAEELAAGLREGAIDVLVAENAYKIGYEAVKGVIAGAKGAAVDGGEVKAVVVTKEEMDKPEVAVLFGSAGSL